MRVARHTRVRPDRIAEYEAAHREIPPELTAAIRAGGATCWVIWRSGTEMFHLIDCADYPALLAHLSALPVNVAWQARMGELLDVAHDYSADGAAAGLPELWSL
ncbi:MAG TPA: L-rhamnose mutarotase [Actinocrinis sp.]|nr:L-rhamnose mutarotase [Actinocrinis sp.]